MVGSTLKIVLSVASFAPVSSTVFLHRHGRSDEGSLNAVAIEQVWQSEMESLVIDKRVHGILSEMKDLYATLPKNEFGNLEPATVRYALHRYYSEKHGWHIKGLDHAGGHWNASAPTSILKEETPSYIMALFEKRLNAHGLNLEDTSVLAATLQDLIFKESSEDLEHIYEVAGLSVNSRVNPEFFDHVIKTYLAAHIDGVDEGGATAESLRESISTLEKEYLPWPATLMWAADLRKSFDLLQTRTNPFYEGRDFAYATAYTREMLHKFTDLQNSECQTLKSQLLDLEHQGTGRVRLSKFYSGSHDDFWPFTESVDYLRSLGALDESLPHKPSVIIANYLMGPSNCMTPSRFYSVCCLNECNELMRTLERQIARPDALPSEIVGVVSRLGSATVHAPRNLSAPLMSRLDEIALHHGGRVPLHGRLFGQWMHHAFPRECPFPHVSGTTKPLSPEDWLEHSGVENPSATDEQIASHMASLWEDSAASGEANADSLPWTEMEELVAHHKHISPRKDGAGSKLTRLVVLLAVAALVGVPMGRFTQSGISLKSAESKMERHLV